MTLTKQWEINTAHDDKKILKKEKKYFYPGKRDICKTCGPQKEWELQTAHDRDGRDSPRLFEVFRYNFVVTS